MTKMLRTIVPIALAVAVALTTGCGASQKQQRKMQMAGESLRLELAQLYVQKNAREAAVPLLQRIIAENPRDVRARLLYGTVLRDLGLYPQAEAELHRALELAPRAAEAHAAYGILLDLTGRHRDALPHHKAAVALAPNNANFRNNLGFSFLISGDPVSAIEPLEYALAIDPGLGYAYTNLGFAYGRAGRLDEAERTFRAGLGETGALINLAILQTERGNKQAAAELRERAYALAPDTRPTELP